MYVYAYVYVHVHVYVYVSVHVCAYAYAYACASVHVRVCVFVRVCVCVLVARCCLATMSRPSGASGRLHTSRLALLTAAEAVSVAASAQLRVFLLMLHHAPRTDRCTVQIRGVSALSAAVGKRIVPD